MLLLKVVEGMEEQVLVVVEVELGIEEVLSGQVVVVELVRGTEEVWVGQADMVEVQLGIGEVVVGPVVVVRHVVEIVVE